MPAPQNYKIHVRFDPFFHFFILPILLLTVLIAGVWYAHHWHTHVHSGLWVILVTIVLLMLALKVRTYAVSLQDRIIRCEERLRYNLLLSPEDLIAVSPLTMRQIIGLRFASDAELPALALRAIKEGLTEKQIKQSIVNWKPDYQRV